jgi:uncharacterized membrane protein YhaH (DUF805 family)
MAKVMASLRHCTGNLAGFSGRDTPGQFWPWAILVFLLGTIASTAIMLPPMMRAMITMFRTLEAARRAGAREPTQEQLRDAFMSQYGADFSALWLPIGAISLVSALLLAAAIVRRLHDRDRTGLWALMPLPFMVFSIANMATGIAFAPGRRGLTATELAASSAGSLYIIAGIVLIVLLVGDGTRGPNRFGPDPRESGSLDKQR